MFQKLIAVMAMECTSSADDLAFIVELRDYRKTVQNSLLCEVDDFLRRWKSIIIIVFMA